MSTQCRLGAAVAAALGLVALSAACSVAAAAPAPALFRVGAASVSLDPQVPVFSGGFGKSPPITRVHDPLAVRAMFVSNGRHAVAMATVDSQAYFAAYQEGPQYGITSVREQAAAAISALGGPRMSPSDIIVQGTHSHAAPTLEGIWGPVPLPYLQKVRDSTVAAIVEAAQSARAALLQWGSVDAPYLDNINTAQTDSYAGWRQDGQLTVLRAVSPSSGATIATFASVPAHPDIVNGARLKLLSADYFGFARATLERQLGGVAIVGPATLGREESPVQTTGLANSQWYACTVSDLIARAIAGARWVTDPSVGSSESFLQVPGTNAALLALVAAWSLPDEQKQQLLDTGGIYPIDRAATPPYLTGSVIGTPLTALRIGRLAYLSMPGEPFPEVRFAIADSVAGADQVVALSKGQDDLGYFYPAFVYPATVAYESDHHVYNVAPQAGDQVIQGQRANVAALGFPTRFDVERPLDNDYAQGLRPGLQALASPATGHAGSDGVFTTTLQAIYAPAAFGGAPLAGRVHWDFGDGTSADTDAVGGPGAAGGGLSEARFTHGFRPGRYTVRLRATDTRGDVATWQLEVVAFPRLRPSIAVRRRGSTYTFTGRAAGGHGTVLAWRWRFGDGAQGDGRVVRHRFARGARPRATLTLADGAGCSPASASYLARSPVRRRARPHTRRRAQRPHPRFTG